MGSAARSLRLALGLLLLLGTLLRRADACSCSPVHPQQAFCNADVVIRAKAVSVKEVDSGNDIYGNPIKRIQYEIKQIKMFKGPDKDIEFIYTAPSSAVCGVSLDIGGKKEYLIAGKAEGNGKLHITLCDFIVPWDTLSTTQKKSLNHRYQMGCECKITRCPMIPCYISSPDECLWMDWVTEKNINGHQAKFFACIKRSDGSYDPCRVGHANWGTAHTCPKTEVCRPVNGPSAECFQSHHVLSLLCSAVTPKHP
ncbi:metalloproteinase inhibitor 2 [Lynx pardinus]|uniref:Metalloproteinase inhibitor 2 n=1 Tax=Lynx pardinus TaxID=191816 RepID=A0A485NW17_LYNPA|nr:metalloproteinase inhibitor 2 [Lynx pardinus]